MGVRYKSVLQRSVFVAPSECIDFFFFFSLFRRLRLRMGEKFAWMPIAFVFMQLISLSLQEDGIADVRANYQEMRNQEKRLRHAAQGIPIPEGYKYDEESRRAFKLHNTKKNWQDAQQTCQMEGGNLVTVDTSEINNILKSERKRIWIGASDLETEETFLWTNGKPLSYNSWAPGEPNNHGNREDCVEVNFRSPGLWNDAVCGALRPFMCEIDLPTIPTSLVSTKSPKITTASSTVSASSKTRSPTTTTRSSPTTKAPSKTTKTTTTTTKTTTKTKPPPSTTTNTTPKKTQTTSKTTTTSTPIQQTTSAVSSSSGGV